MNFIDRMRDEHEKLTKKKESLYQYIQSDFQGKDTSFVPDERYQRLLTVQYNAMCNYLFALEEQLEYFEV